MKKQLKLTNSNKNWSENGRYNVNTVVTFYGQDYQNVTGANSSPDTLVDWFLIGNSNGSPISNEQYKTSDFTAENGVHYIVNDSSICNITDPEPIEGQGYTAYSAHYYMIIDGVTYYNNVLVYRYYVNGSWESKDITNRLSIDDLYLNKVEKGVNNTTTIALTSANLNSTYSDATTGFRVYCTSIIAGKMVYEKTPTGWIGMAVIVP